MVKKILILFFCVVLGGSLAALENNYYLSKNTSSPEISAAEKEIFNYINNLRSAAGCQPMEICPYLCEIARQYSGTLNYEQGKNPDENLDNLKKMVSDSGITDINLSFQFISSPSLAKAEELLNTSSSQNYIFNVDFDTIGIGIKEINEFFKPHLFLISFITLERKVTLNKFPRTLQPNQTETLSGYLNKDYRNPIIKMTLPSGHVKTIPATTGNDRSFSANITTDSGAGDYSIEIMVENRAGPSVAHILPVVVGTPKKEAAPTTVGENFDSEENITELESKLFSLINNTRLDFALPVLTYSEELAGIARNHSLGMLREKKVAHILSDGATLKDRLKDLPIYKETTGENIAVGYSVGNVHQLLLASPGHREAILDNNYNHAGVGIVKDLENNQLYVTEIFVKIIPQINPEDAGSKILNMINEARFQTGLKALALNQKLSEVAQQHTNQMAAQDKLENLPNFGKLLKQKKIKYSVAYTEVLRTPKIEDVLKLKTILIKNLRYLGVGLLQSQKSEYGEGILYITLILTK
jgi:uncharacterized protein YkwD